MDIRLSMWILAAAMAVALAATGTGWGDGSPLGKLDKNNDHRLDISELDEPAQAIFKAHDENSDGYLDEAEYSRIKDAQRPFKSLDESKDGKIDLRELKRAAMKRFQECDTNADGYLDEKELNACLAQGAREGSPAFAAERDRRMKVFDHAQSGSLPKDDETIAGERTIPSSPRYRSVVAPVFSIYF